MYIFSGGARLEPRLLDYLSALVIQVFPNFTIKGFNAADFKVKYGKDPQLQLKMKPEMIEVRPGVSENLYKVRTGDDLGYTIITFFEKRLQSARELDHGQVRLPMAQFAEQMQRRMMAMLQLYAQAKAEAEILKTSVVDGRSDAPAATREARSADMDDDDAEEQDDDDEYAANQMPFEECVGAQGLEPASKLLKTPDGKAK